MKDASGKSKKNYLKNTSLDVATQDYDIKKRYFLFALLYNPPLQHL